MRTYENGGDLTLMTQISVLDDINSIFGNPKIRVALISQPEFDPTYSVLDDLVARNILNSNDKRRIEKNLTTESQILKLLDILKMKDPKSTLAVFIFSLRRNGYSDLAKLIHDEWHGEDDARQNPQYIDGLKQKKCLPQNYLAPEYYPSRPKISLGAGFFALDKKGSIQIKNVLRHAFETKGGDMKSTIDEILLKAELCSPDYYSVIIQVGHEQTWPQGVRIRYYNDALSSKLLIMHVKAKYVTYDSSSLHPEIVKRLKEDEKISVGEKEEEKAKVNKKTFAITVMSTGGVSIEEPEEVKKYIIGVYEIVKREESQRANRHDLPPEEYSKYIGNGVEKHLTSHIAFDLGIGWRWIINFNCKEIFTDSTIRSIKYKENDVVCILWETVGPNSVHIVIERYKTFQASEVKIIKDILTKTASQAVDSKEKLLEWLAKNLLENLMRDYLLENKSEYSWYLFVSKGKLNFSYKGKDYFLMVAEIDDSLQVLLVGFPYLLPSGKNLLDGHIYWRENLTCLCNLTGQITNWEHKANEFADQFKECEQLADKMSEFSGFHCACIQQSADSKADLFKSYYAFMPKHMQDLNDYTEPFKKSVPRECELNGVTKYHKLTFICAFDGILLQWWRISVWSLILSPCILLCCPIAVCCVCCREGKMFATKAFEKPTITLQSGMHHYDHENCLKIESF